ncbi:MltA domain-containing protein [Paralimibaculum aggregatum]|uniref:peptidoglycan lytic exotransglycosylase n=1 Tax=Paralimibaculum aggregatum TaxID=3036245 RepID=A0ABQ6LU31_9RHOB|nr:MltA domain-containing protein [Limibaculum sp. NKW23]GMG85592.1 MltA domain-containing protein [Limibaculum sp. NKW23]
MTARAIGRLMGAGLLAGIALAPAGAAGAAPPPMRLVATAFAALDGWGADDLAEALPALRDSCAAIRAGTPTDPPDPAPRLSARGPWLEACAPLLALPEGAPDAAVRAAVERAFRPWRVLDRDAGAEGLITGYFEPELTGSLTRRSPEQVPLYRPPSADSLRRQTRAEIAAGGLAGQGLELVWLDDPVAAFFLDIQGSGVIRLAEGGSRRVRYVRFNGYGYTAVGRALVEWGEIPLEAITMQSIVAWMRDNPGRRQALMNVNRSYVYFDWLGHDAPQGSQGVDLTPGRSLAVDPRHIPYGAPLWLETVHPSGGAPIRRLMAAQDKGGAIKGVVRADFFWGTGPAAAEQAGRMKGQGRYTLLLPKGLPVPAAFTAE